MFDVWSDEIELTAAVLLFSVVVLLPGQLLLCFKVRRNALRLLPAAALSIAAVVFYCMGRSGDDWDGLGYLFLAAFTGFLLFVCGVGWGVWWIVRRRKRGAPQ